jgi:hypothetical protein
MSDPIPESTPHSPFLGSASSAGPLDQPTDPTPQRRPPTRARTRRPRVCLPCPDVAGAAAAWSKNPPRPARP